MPAPTVRLSAVTCAERNSALHEVREAISAVGGWIDEVNFFSNISVALRFYIAHHSGHELIRLFGDIPLRLDRIGVDDLLSKRSTDHELLCSMQITFFHSEPDLKRHIPKVPGQLPRHARAPLGSTTTIVE